MYPNAQPRKDDLVLVNTNTKINDRHVGGLQCTVIDVGIDSITVQFTKNDNFVIPATAVTIIHRPSRWSSLA